MECGQCIRGISGQLGKSDCEPLQMLLCCPRLQKSHLQRTCSIWPRGLGGPGHFPIQNDQSGCRLIPAIKQLKEQGGDWTRQTIHQVSLGITSQNLRGARSDVDPRSADAIESDRFSDAFQFIEKIEPERGSPLAGKTQHVTTKGKIPGLGNDGRAVIFPSTSLAESCSHWPPATGPTVDELLGARCLHRRPCFRHQHEPLQPPLITSRRRVRAGALGRIGSNRVERREWKAEAPKDRQMAKASLLRHGAVSRRRCHQRTETKIQPIAAVVTPHPPVKPTVPELGSLGLVSNRSRGLVRAADWVTHLHRAWEVVLIREAC